MAREMYDSKQHTLDTIARTVSVSRQTIYRYLRNDTETNMSITPGTVGDVDTIAQDAGLTGEQTVRFRSSVASWAMENMRPTEQEMRLGAEILAGRVTFEEYRRRLGIQRSAASLQG